MIDAQGIYTPFGQESENEPVGIAENGRVLHPQASQVVNVKKAAVIDVIRRHAPESEAVGLRLNQLMQTVKTFCITGMAVEEHYVFLQEGRDLRRSGTELRQQAPIYRAISDPGCPAFRLGTVPLWQTAQSIGKSGQFLRVGVFCTQPGAQDIGTQVEDPRVFAGVYRETVFQVLNVYFPLFRCETQFQIAFFQDLTVMVAQDRQKHFAAQLWAQRIPVDVEIVRVGRRWSMFQHIQPPGIVTAQHTHVVRYDIQHEAHAVRCQGVGKTQEILWTANFLIQRIMIDNVVTVRAAFAGLEDRRSIAMADPETGQIRKNGCGIIEGEVLVKLQTISGAWDGDCRIGGLSAWQRRTRFAQGREQAADVRIFGPLFQSQGEFAPPVRVLTCRAGQVDLVHHGQSVIHLYQ